MVAVIEVVRVPILEDNYVWLLHGGGETAVVDPGEAAPVLAAADARGWRIGQVLITHWHGDHTDGIAGVVAATGATVTGPRAEAHRIKGLDRLVSDGDTVAVCGATARVWDTGGHTNGHISYVFDDDGLLFPGDTLFAMGCGRMFEGTPPQFHASLQRLMTLPDATQVFGAHEYTLGNARYAAVAEPDNAAVAARLTDVIAMRARGEPTLPTTIGLERATNPFTRARDAAQFGERRAAKDSFRG